MPEAVEVQAEVIMLQDLVPSEAFIVGVYAEKMDVDQFVTEVRGLAKDLPTDMEVPSARDTVRSFAYKVAQAKRRLDEYGKDMTRDARKLIESVNGTRKVVVGKLEALQDEVRAPLTAWEKAEEERKAAEEAEKARLEAERLAEIERQRQAELAEARRIAAEAEEARLKAEAEARRVAEEARLKAEAELAERRKALEEAARKHREELEQAQRKAREEAAEAERQRQAEIAEQRLAEKKRQEAEAKVRAEQERVAAEAARVEREAREAEAKAQREEIERMRKKLEEQEQARVKAEMEAQRKAEAEEKARLAAEVVEPPAPEPEGEVVDAGYTVEPTPPAPCDGVTARDQAVRDVYDLLASFLCPDVPAEKAREMAEAVVNDIIDDKVRHVRFDRLTA